MFTSAKYSVPNVWSSRCEKTHKIKYGSLQKFRPLLQEEYSCPFVGETACTSFIITKQHLSLVWNNSTTKVKGICDMRKRNFQRGRGVSQEIEGTCAKVEKWKFTEYIKRLNWWIISEFRICESILGKDLSRIEGSKEWE